MATTSPGLPAQSPRIEVASKVVGRIASIGVDKGDHVTQGQVVARLEDDEYRAQIQQAQDNL